MRSWASVFPGNIHEPGCCLETAAGGHGVLGYNESKPFILQEAVK